MGPITRPEPKSYNRSFHDENHFLHGWRRCVQLGSPLHGPRMRGLPATAALLELQEKHHALIEAAAPFLATLRDMVAKESSYTVLLVNSKARILDMRADRWTNTCGAHINLFPGASAAEEDIGNNGPGTALATGRAISFSGFEHYNQSLLGWQTMGVPILNADGRQMGALGVFLSRHSRIANDTLAQLMLQARMLGLAFRPAEEAPPQKPPPPDVSIRSDQLRMAMRIMGGFAHEVRNPLAVIRGFAQLLLEGGIDDRTQHYLSLIMDEVDRINERIKGFISLSSHDHMDYQDLNIRTLLSDVELLLQNYTSLNSTRLVVEAEPGIGSVRGEAEQLRQAILNLVYNALESIPAGGTVTLRAARAGDRVRITVKDNGAGIATGIMPRIFEPFFSTRDGVGLGLAVARDIVRRHGGTVDVDSIPERGTTATIELPAVEKP